MSSIQQQRLQQPAQPPEGASYEDLRRQVQALNEAFGTISDVLVEEVDAIRSEMARRHEHIECEIKSVREQVARVSTEVAEVRTQLTGGASVGVSINQLENGLERLQSEMAALSEQMRGDELSSIRQIEQEHKRSSRALAQVSR